ncbi:MAG: hypothetical protein J5870_06240 [Clostridia bacterium]|nr:hypothetical protein [Clostridia bacterium]
MISTAESAANAADITAIRAFPDNLPTDIRSRIKATKGIITVKSLLRYMSITEFVCAPLKTAIAAAAITDRPVIT